MAILFLDSGADGSIPGLAAGESVYSPLYFRLVAMPPRM